MFCSAMQLYSNHRTIPQQNLELMTKSIEKVVKINNSSDGKRRICFLRRDDGLFQFWEEEQVLDYLGKDCWTPTRLISGLFETEELALHAAQTEIDWLKAKTPDTKTIYIPLLDEGTIVSRPTQGVPLGKNQYQVLATPNYNSENEHWQFPPSSIVECVEEKENNQTILIARTLVKQQVKGVR